MLTETMMIAVEGAGHGTTDPAATARRPSRPRWPWPVRDEKTLTELALQFLPLQFDVHPSQISPWRSPLLDNAAGVFSISSSARHQ